ncbi:hypothetical protein NITHO_5160027 [Nitrolancea hollandica Lb]|uniref:Uncharacterized protein n=1 Tax=Nitrolancea hollandica Lb TaxID=1129897 RepID=I4ELM1_9BACT|nr:hypothetical protein NITHO_5160027 [Nitrolancea hollandica Lb]
MPRYATCTGTNGRTSEPPGKSNKPSPSSAKPAGCGWNQSRPAAGPLRLSTFTRPCVRGRKNRETPRNRTDKTARSPFVSFVSALSTRSGIFLEVSAMSEFHSQWLEAQSETPEDRTDKSPDAPTCSECGRRLYLPASQILGRCIRAGCQSEAEFVDSLARLKMHHERTKRAVAARVKELGGR